MGKITLESMKEAARDFAVKLSAKEIEELFGVTDGKAVGTYVEHKFTDYLKSNFKNFKSGNSASGIDFPDLNVDLKVTSIRQPQSSCPFRHATQKVYGLGYHLLVFVYDKVDNPETNSAQLNIMHGIFVNKEQTADYQTTYGLNEIIRRNGNTDDIEAFLEERNLPLDDIGRRDLAQRIIQNPPQVGYLTVSNALQWRLQFGRVVSLANQVEGVEDLLA